MGILFHNTANLWNIYTVLPTYFSLLFPKHALIATRGTKQHSQTITEYRIGELIDSNDARRDTESIEEHSPEDSTYVSVAF